MKSETFLLIEAVQNVSALKHIRHLSLSMKQFWLVFLNHIIGFVDSFN